jgi:type II secretory pathway component GspD/PulD (secretin)
MKASLCMAALCFPLLAFGAGRGQIPPLPPGAGGVSQVLGDASKPVKLDFTSISISQAVAVVYSEILRQPYVIDPAVLKDDRAVSIRFDAAKGDIRAFWRDFLDSVGIEVSVRSGVDYVAVKKAVEHREEEPERQPFIYRPKHRSVAYLVEMLSPLFQSGGFALNRSVRAPLREKINIGGAGPASPSPSSPIPTGSAASLVDQDSDTLIFQGTDKEIAALGRLLPQVDVAVGEVVVKAAVYEVTTGESDGTAFSLAANLLGGKLGISIGSGSDLANAVTVRTVSIEAAVSALSADSRFKAVSTPLVRVKSGQQAQLVVGQDVPTLGAVTVPQQGGQSVQSVEYRSSGVILGLLPTVRELGVEVRVDQQISDFARTETGVNNSPTLTKRSLTTTVTAEDGELIVLGGLVQNKQSRGHSGFSFLPRFMQTTSGSDTRTEILLLLHVSKVLPLAVAN